MKRPLLAVVAVLALVAAVLVYRWPVLTILLFVVVMTWAYIGLGHNMTTIGHAAQWKIDKSRGIPVTRWIRMRVRLTGRPAPVPGPDPWAGGDPDVEDADATDGDSVSMPAPPPGPLREHRVRYCGPITAERAA